MSHTDHARPPRVRVTGHRPQVHAVRLYGDESAYQSMCSCGLLGHLLESWNAAQNEGRDHVAERAIATEAADR